MWETLLWLLVGAVIGFLPTWFLSNRSHKWELEEKKRERTRAAREIRLKEGEEKINEYTSEFYYLVQLSNQFLYYKPDTAGTVIKKTLVEYEKAGAEMDKGKAINEVSIKSLGDEHLSKCWENVNDSFEDYKEFSSLLSGFPSKNGRISNQQEIESLVEKEYGIRKRYYSSVEEFIKRINELRSQ